MNAVHTTEGYGFGEVLFYLYGIVRAEQRLPVESGIALIGVRRGDLMALVEMVPAREFAPDVLEQQLNSLEWVTRLARKHQRLLESAMRYGQVLPARLCTLFSGFEAVSTRLAMAGEELKAALDRLGERQEWGLKIFCDEAKLAAVLEADDPRILELSAAAAEASPGRRYVLSKERSARLAELVAERIDDVRDETLAACEALKLYAREKTILPAGDGLEAEQVVANLAVLASPAGRKRLEAQIEEIGHRLGAGAISFQLSGPWPPYSFTSAHDEMFCDDNDGAPDAMPDAGEEDDIGTGAEPQECH